MEYFIGVVGELQINEEQWERAFVDHMQHVCDLPDLIETCFKLRFDQFRRCGGVQISNNRSSRFVLSQLEGVVFRFLVLRFLVAN